jgi:2,4-dienoyl-CoA reductase-like NADH-dependent reductase (Old Yellow Enzyme family)
MAKVMTALQSFLAPGRIGTLALKNRLVRAPTSETMATAEGMATEALVTLYRTLAAGGAGLLITGHIFVEPDGQYEPRQVGLHSDDCVAPLRRVTQAVHDAGGLIFAELAHAGSQSTLPNVTPFSPSVIPNAIHDRAPVEMTGGDISRIIRAFGNAARRAKDAGFDGIHIHAGNGYLISQFNSPLTNRRTDEWGGDAQRRGHFLTQIYLAIRDAVGAQMPVTVRYGVVDAGHGGLSVEEGVQRAAALADLGLAAVEPTYNVMTSYKENIRPYVGNTIGQAFSDLFFQQLFAARSPEAYYRSLARAIKLKTALPVILVGGIRTTQIMDEVIRSGDADFLSMARPFIREPDLPLKLAAGRRGRVACVSCNLCFKHEGLDPLRCWRTPKYRLLSHFWKQYIAR